VLPEALVAALIATVLAAEVEIELALSPERDALRAILWSTEF
jgi:hypothetical protein